MLTLRELGPELRADWDRVVLEAPRGQLFHMSDWLDAVSAAQRLRLIRLGIYDGGTLIGVFPVFVKRFALLTVVASPLVIEDTHYLGPVVDDAKLPDVMQAFSDYVSRR